MRSLAIELEAELGLIFESVVLVDLYFIELQRRKY